ncbi:gamma-glutamyltransferase family protein [Pseudomonas typographi]|uniref:Gamma-glutamyltransferase n=1 Tax=Pseudomonas typographi TaxID=2715964 RepID=A0ABR7YVP2_9PSED|nr:gamma-glutamyltransferase [Pseudomonas typographi]MBD1549838.1 gamma-glutamyltransferase [Pseudomonas typographi]MBD1585219.1 gamma-glutamyltransferase [Pseudomonas typographi]MBD1597266.1 gamma-glutamyltransferase [Pseudomonas typographi]
MIATSTRAVICTPHAQASTAGMRVLDAGGTAIDAMLAASAMLAAVFPHMTGLGGDALWMIHDSKVRTIVGIGQAGQRLPECGAISVRGPASVASTAGAMASWQTAANISRHEWNSRLGWADLLEDAASVADAGVPISQSQLFWQTLRRPLIEQLPDLHRLCKTDGRWLGEGDTLRQPELANTLRHLAKHGVEDFYTGKLAQAFGEAFDQLGCGLTTADLAATQAHEIAPISVRYREGRLYNVAPPCQGLYTLQAMAALQHKPLAQVGNGSALYYHYLVEAIKQGLLRRNEQLCDPLINPWDFAASLDDAQIRHYADAIDDQRAAPWNEPGRSADTVWMAATDAQGRTACLIQSLFHDFGSGCILGDTGVLWQNRAAGFNAKPEHVNGWAPGKRPAHTLNPSCYLADDGRRWFFGTQGGDGQPQTQIVLATQLIDYQQPIDLALQTPRFLLGRSFFDSTDNLKLEGDMSATTIEGLAALGHEVEIIPARSPMTGHAGVIAIDTDGVRRAMHDPRGEGTGVGQAG